MGQETIMLTLVRSLKWLQEQSLVFLLGSESTKMADPEVTFVTVLEYSCHLGKLNNSPFFAFFFICE